MSTLKRRSGSGFGGVVWASAATAAMQSETQSQHSRREQSRRISDFGDRLRTNGFDFQVLGVDLRGSVACEIMLAPQAFQLRGQLLLSALIKAREGHFRGPKILTEI